MSGAAQLLIERWIGGFFVVRETDITLAATAQEILRNDPERVGWLICVTGATQGQFAFNVAPTATTAILIAGSGGTWSSNVREDFILPSVAVYGNVAAGNTTIHIVEVVRVGAPVE